MYKIGRRGKGGIQKSFSGNYRHMAHFVHVLHVGAMYKIDRRGQGGEVQKSYIRKLRQTPIAHVLHEMQVQNWQTEGPGALYKIYQNI